MRNQETFNGNPVMMQGHQNTNSNMNLDRSNGENASNTNVQAQTNNREMQAQNIVQQPSAYTEPLYFDTFCDFGFFQN